MRTNDHCPFTIFKFIYLFIYLFTSFSGHRPAQRECARTGLIGPMQKLENKKKVVTNSQQSLP